MSDDPLRELAKDLPWDRPDPARRDAVRASLILAAADAGPIRRRRAWLPVATFAAGAAAAAAIVLVVARPRADSDGSREVALVTTPGQITASPTARLEQSVVATPTGVDEIVHIHDGTVRLAIADVKRGDHVRVHTRDANVEGAGDYEVSVAADSLSAVAVRTGSVRVTVVGQPSIFLAAGQTWRASVITSDLTPRTPAAPTTAPASRTPEASGLPPVSDVRTTDPTGTQPSDPVRTRIPSVSDGRTAANDPVGTRPAATSGSRSADVSGQASARTAGASESRTPSISGVRTGDTSSARKPEVSESRTPDNASRTPDSASRTPAITEEPRAGSAMPAVRGVSEVEKHFQAGWKLLRDGKPNEAARELAAAADANPKDALAADARYFQAIALARSGRKTEAEGVLVAFLDHAPTSLRRGRAAVLLGRMIAERGDAASARAWFTSAVDDRDPDVATAARAGVAALPKAP